MVSPREESGAEIAQVLHGSVAEMAMLRVGDLITTIDRKLVKTPMELAAELQNRAPGSQVRLLHVAGSFPKETVVVLGAPK
jgi:putative serine protease PepD